MPGPSLTLFCLLSLLYATMGPAICWASVSAYNRGGYSWRSASPVSLDICQVNTCPHPRSLAGLRFLTSSPRILHADRPYFLLWESSLTGPLHCYRWRGGLWHCLWPVSSVVVMCKTAPLALAVPWGAALLAGRGVRMMIAFWPWPALHYIHNESCTSSTAASKW